VLQIPAFLCGQTDLLVGGGEDGPGDEHQEGSVPRARGTWRRRAKVEQAGNDKAMVCERGHELRLQRARHRHAALAGHGETAETGRFDATHSVQQPGRAGQESGGRGNTCAGAGAAPPSRTASRRVHGTTRTRITPRPHGPTWSSSRTSGAARNLAGRSTHREGDADVSAGSHAGFGRCHVHVIRAATADPAFHMTETLSASRCTPARPCLHAALHNRRQSLAYSGDLRREY